MQFLVLVALLSVIPSIAAVRDICWYGKHPDEGKPDEKGVVDPKKGKCKTRAVCCTNLLPDEMCMRPEPDRYHPISYFDVKFGPNKRQIVLAHDVFNKVDDAETGEECHRTPPYHNGLSILDLKNPLLPQEMVDGVKDQIKKLTKPEGNPYLGKTSGEPFKKREYDCYKMDGKCKPIPKGFNVHFYFDLTDRFTKPLPS